MVKYEEVVKKTKKMAKGGKSRRWHEKETNHDAGGGKERWQNAKAMIGKWLEG